MNQPPKNQNRSMTPTKPVDVEAFKLAIQDAMKAGSLEAIMKLPEIEQTVALAKGMQMFEAALTDEIMDQVFMPLQGRKLGFRHDRQSASEGKPKSYSIAEVREVLIECFMRGFRPMGNEFNIIASGFYATKEGLERKVFEYEGLTDLRVEQGAPQERDKTAWVPMYASWKLHGKPDEIRCEVTKDGDNVKDTRIVVRVNAGQGPDAMLGKAKRKLYDRILYRLSGVKTPSADDMIETQGETIPDGASPQSANDAAIEELTRNHAEKARKADTAASAPADKVREPGEDG